MSDPTPELIVEEADVGRRLDVLLAQRLPQFSRTLLKKTIDAGGVTVSGRVERPAYKLELGDAVCVVSLAAPAEGPTPEPISLDFVYEDDDIVVVNKPPGMVVHPAKGHWAGTLTAALAHHFGDGLSKTGGPTRPGIVHRLDRDTSGVILIAKHDQSHERLAKQFQDRSTEKEYLAIIMGEPDRDGDVIDEPIGPHPHIREKKAIRRGHPDSRDAVTTFEVIERFRRCVLLRAKPKTGRTHQIRVHMAHIGHPILCDKQYGGRIRITASELRGGVAGTDEPALLERQALHAHRLTINHPMSGERMTFEAPIPEDIERVLRFLRKNS